MSYNTWWSGEFTFDPPLNQRQKKRLEDFLKIDHDEELKKHGIWKDGELWERFHPRLEHCAQLMIYPLHHNDVTLGMDDNGGTTRDDVIGLVKLLRKTLLKTWGVKMEGRVDWEGEESGDYGSIIVQGEANELIVAHGHIAYELDEERSDPEISEKTLWRWHLQAPEE